jgi:hypothetical protein
LTEHTPPHDAIAIALTPFDLRQPLTQDPDNSCTTAEQPQGFKGKFASLASSLVDRLSLRTVRPKLLAVRRSSWRFMKTTALLFRF